jgi:hypothetical protein
MACPSWIVCEPRPEPTPWLGLFIIAATQMISGSSFRACMIGSSVVPGLPKRWMMPSSFSNAKRLHFGSGALFVAL